MKKLIYTTLALATMTLTSCNTSSPAGDGSYYEVLISKIEIKPAAGAAQTWEFKYANFGETTPNTTKEFKARPVLVEQSVSGTDKGIVQIKYKHELNVGSETTLTVTHEDKDGTTTRMFSENAQGTAYKEIIDGEKVDYEIKYQDAGYFRTQVGDTTLYVSPADNNYQEASLGEDVITRYEYSQVPNFAWLQQYGIYGSEYYWHSNCFGHPSHKLLYKMIKKENVNGTAKEVTYEYGYTLSYEGFVLEERITRDNKDFRTTKYSYQTVVVRPIKPTTPANVAK